MSHTHPDSHDDGGKGHNEGDKEPRVDLSADVFVAKDGALVVVKDVVVGRDVDEEEGDGADDEGEPVVPLDVDLLVDLAGAVETLTDAGKILSGTNGCPVNPNPESNGVL